MLPVDALGQPARLDETHEIANRYGLVVEDLCESLGPEHSERKAPGRKRGMFPCAGVRFLPDQGDDHKRGRNSRNRCSRGGPPVLYHVQPEKTPIGPNDSASGAGRFRFLAASSGPGIQLAELEQCLRYVPSDSGLFCIKSKDVTG